MRHQGRTGRYDVPRLLFLSGDRPRRRRSRSGAHSDERDGRHRGFHAGVVAARPAPANHLAGAGPADAVGADHAGALRASGRGLRRSGPGGRIRAHRRHPARTPGIEPVLIRPRPARRVPPARLARRGHALPGMQRRAEPPPPYLPLRRNRGLRACRAELARTASVRAAGGGGLLPGRQRPAEMARRARRGRGGRGGGGGVRPLPPGPGRGPARARVLTDVQAPPHRRSAAGGAAEVPASAGTAGSRGGAPRGELPRLRQPGHRSAARLPRCRALLRRGELPAVPARRRPPDADRPRPRRPVHDPRRRPEPRRALALHPSRAQRRGRAHGFRGRRCAVVGALLAG